MSMYSEARDGWRRSVVTSVAVGLAALTMAPPAYASMWDQDFLTMRACMQPAPDYKQFVQALEADGWRMLPPSLPPEAVHMLAVENFVTFNMPLFPRADEARPEFWQQVWNDAHDFAQGTLIAIVGPETAGENKTIAHIALSKSDSIINALATFSEGKAEIICTLIVPSHEIQAFEGVTSADWLEAFEGTPAAIQMAVEESDLDAIANPNDASEFVALSYLASSTRLRDLTQGAFEKGDEDGFLILGTSLISQPKAVTP